MASVCPLTSSSASNGLYVESASRRVIGIRFCLCLCDFRLAFKAGALSIALKAENRKRARRWPPPQRPSFLNRFAFTGAESGCVALAVYLPVWLAYHSVLHPVSASPPAPEADSGATEQVQLEVQVAVSAVAPKDDSVVPAAQVEASLPASLVEPAVSAAVQAADLAALRTADCPVRVVSVADWVGHLAAVSAAHSVVLHSAVAQVADLVGQQAADFHGRVAQIGASVEHLVDSGSAVAQAGDSAEPRAVDFLELPIPVEELAERLAEPYSALDLVGHSAALQSADCSATVVSSAAARVVKGQVEMRLVAQVSHLGLAVD